MEIETDGSILPKDALTEAAKILIHHFMLFSDERISLEDEESAETESYDEKRYTCVSCSRLSYTTWT